MNLADFPISALQRQQSVGENGIKKDTVVFRSSRYDPEQRRSVPQQVTLTTSSRYGLPTPADEDVILALLCVGREAHDLTEAKVYFTPHRLFQIMRWSPNSRSYGRLQAVLRRLKALTIIFENSWWDARGKAYEQELATGIIAEYSIVRQHGRKTGGSQDIRGSWVVWTPRFFESITSGNIKKIDLERLFELRLPTARRMYRFLDKRFYRTSELEMDLRDFACGHIGLNETTNIATLKQRLAPAIKELEERGVIQPARTEERFRKIRPGIWRVRFERQQGRHRPGDGEQPEPRKEPSPPEQLIADFYRAWKGSDVYGAGAKHIAQAEDVIARYGHRKAAALIPRVVERLKTRWPNAQTFTAFCEYVDEVAGEYDKQQQRDRHRRERRAQEMREQRLADEQDVARNRFQAQWQPAWDALSKTEQQAMRFSVLADEPWLEKMPSVRDFRCLELLAKRSTGAPSNASSKS